MPIVNPGFWIRVQDGQVTQVWDYAPSEDVRAVQDGWREAVEITPEVNPMREYVNGYTIALDPVPAEIIWGVAYLSVDDRKGMLISEANNTYQQVINAEVAKETDPDPNSHMDMKVVEAANQAYQARVAQVNACTTQEELDAIWNL